MKRLVMTFGLLALTSSLAIAAEVTWSQNIKPLFDARCVGCHGADAPEYAVFKLDKDTWKAKSIGPRMDTYSHLIFYTGWPDTGALMRRLDDGTNGKDGKAGNMYQYLGDNDAERKANLALFKAWVGNWTGKRFDALTKEDLAAIKVPY